MRNNTIFRTGDIIRMNRGDTCFYKLFINQGTDLIPKRYNLQENDKLYFAVLEPNSKFEDAIIKKIYTCESETSSHGDIIIKIDSKDTEFLHPGTYYYTIKLRQLDDEEESEAITTVISNTLFYIN